MKKSIALAILTTAAAAFAQTANPGVASFFTGIQAAAVIAMAVAAFGCALGQGNAIAKALEGIARQPEAAGKIQGPLLIGLGFIESLAIYVLVIALIIIFANPAVTAVTH
ncbi:MAG TPA: ATP synthase F0 subunit C [bacterium]|nr:ATP synthase F0 subunit C [bacterium]